MQGAYTVSEVNTIDPSTTQFMGVSCAMGDLMVGGGYQTLHPDVILFEHNRPSVTDQTWEVAAFNGDMSAWDVTIYVRCLDMTP